MRTTTTLVATAAAAVATAAATVLGAPAASAVAPADRETFELDCGGGQTYVIAVNSGLGAFTPARVVGTNRMLIPIAFDDFVFTATPPGGETITGSEPGDVKGSVAERSPRPQVTCTFGESYVLTEPDPEFGLPAGTVVTFSGTVTAFLTGR